MSSHYDILTGVIAKLKTLSFNDITPNMIYHAEFPFDRQPAVGLACGMLREIEGAGTNEHDDYRYGIVIVQVFGGGGLGNYSQSRSDWRSVVRQAFHRKLIGGIDNEIITKVNPGSIKRSKQWSDWGIDTSVMEVWTWVREARGA